MINRLLMKRIEYGEKVVKNMKKRDGIGGLAFASAYALYMFWYMLTFYSEKIAVTERYSFEGLTFVLPVILPAIIFVFAMLKIKNENLHSICINSDHIAKSFLLGIFLSLPLFIIKRNKLFYIGYYKKDFLASLVLTGIYEELIFRGYMAPRLQVLFKKKWCGLIVGGLLFGIFHIPIYIVTNQFNILQGLKWYINNGMIGLILGHIFFVYLTTRYDSIVPGIIFHTFMNY